MAKEKHLNLSIKNQIAKSIFFSILSYVTIIILLNDLPLFIKENGLFKLIINLSSWAENKAMLISENMIEKNLALNFLGNIRKLSFSEAKSLQSSGLMHLLAISGGQVVPLAMLFSYFLSKITFTILKNIVKPSLLIKVIYYVKLTSSLLISLLICSLFGCTGALIRVFSLFYFIQLPTIQAQYISIFKQFPYIMNQTFSKISVIILTSFIFGNVFINYSFLLSALGATVAQMAIYFSNYLLQENHLIFKTVLSTTLTSFFTGFILYPFSEINLMNSCLANILALPVVCFFIAPLSLLALFIPDQFLFYPIIIKCLDISLFFLKQISFAFDNPYANINPFNKQNPLFTLNGLLYLNTILLFLWISMDCYKQKKLFLARMKFANLKF
ncbi:ComEC/Rec2 family competence protein [Silvanigrella aquatica]|uniref:ComEC/Rec2-related protein domain-containing protein n=1 Tax=Silvanigrella aquatica TaxID=1915309 RepID=A0A1L4CXB0_9BACT|nr:ComEC/Rec2 family competence protein [Silvanigrella aquatica]APJ02584.1 hypothetical protein AXG55_00995 [Silvanigrella aquatica]